MRRMAFDSTHLPASRKLRRDAMSPKPRLSTARRPFMFQVTMRIRCQRCRPGFTLTRQTHVPQPDQSDVAVRQRQRLEQSLGCRIRHAVLCACCDSALQFHATPAASFSDRLADFWKLAIAPACSHWYLLLGKAHPLARTAV